MISTAGDATLSVADPSSNATGRLVNGSFSLAQALQARANNGAYAAVGGSSNPTAIHTYTGPISNDRRDDRLQADDRRRTSRCGPARTQRR